MVNTKGRTKKDSVELGIDFRTGIDSYFARNRFLKREARDFHMLHEKMGDHAAVPRAAGPAEAGAAVGAAVGVVAPPLRLMICRWRTTQMVAR